MAHLMRSIAPVAVLTIAASAAHAYPEFTRSTIAKVRANAISAATESWEIGTMMEAVTELDAPHLAVFEASNVPVSSSANLPAAVTDALDKALAEQPAGQQYYFQTGAVGDSASIGVTALISGIASGNSKYITGAQNQLNFLLNVAPHQGDIISQRNETFQAWADFVSMAPPFIAYAGVTAPTKSQSLLENAYVQCQGYRSILQDPGTKLWRHIIGGSWNDSGLWLTGNAWAAYGMLRVQQTIAKSEYAGQMQNESADLINWTNEILSAVWDRQSNTGAMANYLDQNNQFEDSAGTALLAAASYRLAMITGSSDHITAASRALQRIITLTDSDGWLQGAVDPEDFDKQTSGGAHSPEAQSFVLMLDASSRAYYDAASLKTSVEVTTSTPSSSVSSDTWADVIEDVVDDLTSEPTNAKA